MGGSFPYSIPAAEIEAALKSKSGSEAFKMLMSLTDLFANKQATLSQSHVQVFDEIMLCMVQKIERDALIEFSIRAAAHTHAPPSVVQRLARDDSIAIAGPVLTNSPQLSDRDLVEIAKSKTQAHLASIARRSQLNEAVTDVLVDHGDANVASEVAMNPGARISAPTMGKLVMRADGDSSLTESIFKRRDLSPNHFRQLVSQATETVRNRLAKCARPEQQEALQQVLSDISERLAARRTERRDYSAARRQVATFSQDTGTTKNKLQSYAVAGNTAETVVILSVLSGIAIEDIDALLDGVDPLPVLIICRSLDMPWPTVAAVIAACWSQHAWAKFTVYYEREYRSLTTESAHKIVRFWQGRQRVSNALAPAAVTP